MPRCAKSSRSRESGRRTSAHRTCSVPMKGCPRFLDSNLAIRRTLLQVTGKPRRSKNNNRRGGINLRLNYRLYGKISVMFGYWPCKIQTESLPEHTADGSVAVGLGQPVSSCRESETHAPRPASASKPGPWLLDGVSSRRVQKSKRAGAGTAGGDGSSP